MTKNIFLLVIFFFGLSLSAYPCRCKEITVIDAVKTYDIVAKGKVLSVDRISNEAEYTALGLQVDTMRLSDIQKKLKMYGVLVVAKLEIEKVYKGEQQADVILILTMPNGASCGYQGFEPNYNYIVYGMEASDPFGMGASSFTTMTGIPEIVSSISPYCWTNSCSRTQVWNREEEKLVLKAVSEIME